MNQQELNKKLELHKKWLNNEEDGIRLNLRYADLQRADLRYADLRGADLQDANLQEAYLQGANLQGADLRGADLQDAYLQGAYLQGADLQGAKLQGAKLQGADLQGADIDFSCMPIWCGGLNFRIDEKQAKQLMYHFINLMQYSDIDTSKVVKKNTYKWLSDSHLVTEHNLPVLEEKVE